MLIHVLAQKKAEATIDVCTPAGVAKLLIKPQDKMTAKELREGTVDRHVLTIRKGKGQRISIVGCMFAWALVKHLCKEKTYVKSLPVRA